MKDKINIKQGLLIFIALVITSVVVASFLGTEIAFFIEKQVAKNNIEADVTIVIPEELLELPPPQEWGIPTNYRLTSSVYLVG